MEGGRGTQDRRHEPRGGAGGFQQHESSGSQSGVLSAQEIAELRKNAERGDAVAQVQLASLYWEGDGVSKNPAESVKWYRKAAEQIDVPIVVEAQHALGIAYARGHGVPQDM